MRFVLALLAITVLAARAAAPVITNFTVLNGIPGMNIQSQVGTTNQIQYTSYINETNWLVLTNVVLSQSPYWFEDVTAPPSPKRFYRVMALPTNALAPANMVLVPAGTFTMGDTFSEGNSDELPMHAVYVSAFYMDTYEVTKALWDEVYTWATNHGYSFEFNASGKAANHPAHSMTWYGAVKWCNARSEWEGRLPAYYTDASLTTVYKGGQLAPFVNWNAGYRLPTEAEWEKSARSGTGGHRFPWLDIETITQSRANYYSYWFASYSYPYYSYDVNATPGYHPAFTDGISPYTSPVGYFQANGYGLHDMAGNVSEWCWDRYGSSYYRSSLGTNPRGPATTGSSRVLRGGGWYNNANNCRSALRNYTTPDFTYGDIGFRSVLPSNP